VELRAKLSCSIQSAKATILSLYKPPIYSVGSKSDFWAQEKKDVSVCLLGVLSNWRSNIVSKGDFMAKWE
jgi:hypothetical protein